MPWISPVAKASVWSGMVVVMAVTASGVTGALLAIPGAAPAFGLAAALYIGYLAYRIATAPPLGSETGRGRPPAFLGGVLLALVWPVGLAACATWLLVALLFRYSSLAALLALAATPLYAWIFLADLQMVEFCIIVAVLVWAKHHANIRRLLRGGESKIGQKS